MHAYLLIGKNNKLLNQKIDEISHEKKAKTYRFAGTKIDDIREIKKFVKLNISEPTIIIVENIDEASTEAINAFLKTLEEPQTNLSFILTAANFNRILPTIISRCEPIKVGGQKEVDTTVAEKFLNLNIGKQFLAAEKIKKRDEAVSFTTTVIIYLQKRLVSETDKQIGKQIAVWEKARSAILANGNVQIQLTNAIISTYGR